MGLCIVPQDEVIYGNDFQQFHLKEQNFIMDEIAIRRRYGEIKA